MTKAKNVPQVRNLTEIMRNVDEQSLTEGLTWYDRARAHAALLDPNDVSRAAGVIAALSPLNSWPQNLMLASQVYAGNRNIGYMGNGKRKAYRIFDGEAPLDVLGGNKVRSFYRNIIGDDSVFAVTIDRHAIDAACGRTLTDKQRSAHVKNDRLYWELAGMYERTAKIINAEKGTDYSPSQIQAIVWVWWRRNRAQAFHGDA